MIGGRLPVPGQLLDETRTAAKFELVTSGSEVAQYGTGKTERVPRLLDSAFHSHEECKVAEKVGLLPPIFQLLKPSPIFLARRRCLGDRCLPTDHRVRRECQQLCLQLDPWSPPDDRQAVSGGLQGLGEAPLTQERNRLIPPDPGQPSRVVKLFEGFDRSIRLL